MGERRQKSETVTREYTINLHKLLHKRHLYVFLPPHHATPRSSSPVGAFRAEVAACRRKDVMFVWARVRDGDVHRPFARFAFL